jgi:hypothetical protein
MAVADLGLGSLSKVPARSVWSDEARVLTPWLAENPELLGEALGMDLELLGAEVPVGPFSADLWMRDTSTDRTVVIENLLIPTDHDHLGKLITYASGLEADYAVLLAEQFRPEHLSALQWLNRMSRDEVGFFGVEIEAWKIGDSPVAPRLNVVAKPDQWSREVRSNAGELSELRLLYREWWGQFLPVMRDTYPGWTSARSPQAQNWMNFPAGRSDLKYAVVFGWPTGASGYQLRVELYIDSPDGELGASIFRQLEAKKAEIEAAFGEPLDWQALEDRRASRVAAYYPKPASVEDEEQWPTYRDWAIAAIGRLRDVMQPHVANLGT